MLYQVHGSDHFFLCQQAGISESLFAVYVLIYTYTFHHTDVFKIVIIPNVITFVGRLI
jgi:hypothetical protein